jgi:predicted unusual protein kinase regulating ubiquinone biosynthesis (AarF/ABC1/UbiB family)
VLRAELGPAWSEHFESFERIPFAAASIGQVHAGVLAAAASPTGRAERVAVKVQFPRVAESIASDLGYMRVLLTAGRLLPKGLFLDRTVEVRVPAACASGADAGAGDALRACGRVRLHARGRVPAALPRGP